MKILLIKCSQIPPKTYGGTQRVVYWLAKDLYLLGHEVSIMADADSDIFKENSNIKHISPPKGNEKINDLIPDDIDIVHYHEDPKEKPLGKYLITYHKNALKNSVFYPNTTFLSKNHAKTHGAKYYVYHGIPVEEYPFSLNKKNCFLYMSLLNWPIKNPMLAIKLAIESKINLQLSGGFLAKAWKTWRPFMLIQRFKIKQYVTENGFVGSKEKDELLKQSSLLFFVVNWQEPFGLIMLEALASGTPVLASPNGSLPEIIEHGKNGYIVHSKKEAIKTIKEHFQKSNSEKQKMFNYCRSSAFTVRQMTSSYLKLYDKVIKDNYIYPPEESKQFKLDKSGVIKIK